MKRRYLIAGLLVLISLSAGCLLHDERAEDDAILVAVTIPPMKEMVEEIGRGRVSVVIAVPPGSDPHTFEPTPGQITRLSRSRIYFRVGEGLLPFEERLLQRLSSLNPEMIIIDTSVGIDMIRTPGVHCHHQEVDPHIWLSPQNGAAMAGSIAEAFIEADPEHREFYRENLDQYRARIDAIDTQLRDDLHDLRITRFIVTHDAWGYFARDYGLEQIAVHPAGREPTARDIQEVIMAARRDGISVVFIEPQFPGKAAETIAAEIGGVVVVIDPLAEEYLENFRHVVVAFEEVMR